MIIQTITTYDPTMVEADNRFYRLPKCTTYAQNPNTMLWHICPDDVDETKVDWHQLFDTTESIVAPIQKDTTYLTRDGAMRHNLWICYWESESKDKIDKLIPVGNITRMSSNKDSPNSEFDTYCFVTVNEDSTRLVQLDYSEPPLITAFSNYASDAQNNTRIALQAIKSCDPDAAVQLLGVMELISESCYCAGWITGSEYNLFDIMQSAIQKRIVLDTRYGINFVTSTHIELMIKLYHQCKGWWYWNDKCYQFQPNQTR